MTNQPKMLSCCGLDCSTCQNIDATINNDKVYFEKVARSISDKYKKDINPDDLPCEGCMTDGIKSKYTLACTIRKCNSQKNTPNCAHCDEYPCDSIKKMLSKCPKELEENLVQERLKMLKK